MSQFGKLRFGGVMLKPHPARHWRRVAGTHGPTVQRAPEGMAIGLTLCVTPTDERGRRRSEAPREFRGNTSCDRDAPSVRVGAEGWLCAYTCCLWIEHLCGASRVREPHSFHFTESLGKVVLGGGKLRPHNNPPCTVGFSFLPGERNGVSLSLSRASSFQQEKE